MILNYASCAVHENLRVEAQPFEICNAISSPQRLRNWEMRERKRRHEYKEESRAEKERKAEMAKEARRYLSER